ncbi:hypothetical protein BH11MYX1_BH11MYX1_22990 [soil metagenome]
MSPLARKIYRQLRKRLTAGKQSITYRELAALTGDHHPRSPAFHAALGEVANACRHTGLPVLPAIVWRSDSKRPSTGYYKVAHPRAHTDEARISAWRKEHARVVGEIRRFPLELGANAV